MKKTYSLNSLTTFEVCARVESVQETASLLCVTPSAVSHQLKKLEEEMGVALFHRSHRKITVTAKGEMLQRTLARAFSLISDTVEEIQEEDQAELVINVLPVFSIRWLNPRLLGFFNHYPDIDLTIKNSYRIENLSMQKCDLAIRWGTGNWPDIYCEKLFDEYVIPVLSPDLLKTVDISDEKNLLTLPLIQLFEGADHWEFWAKQNSYHLPNKVKYIKYNDPAAALQAATDGLGVVLGPISLVHSELKNGKLLAPIAKPINTNKSYYLVTTEEKTLESPRVANFTNWLRSEARAFEANLLNDNPLFVS